MHPSRFHRWLAHTLGQPIEEVSYLLSQEMAIEFLMSWAIFESRCFSGFMKLEHLDPFADRIVKHEMFCATILREHFDHFHARYQDQAKRRNLFHQQRCERFKEIAEAPARTSSAHDIVFFCSAVAYRFRNNMFHGRKGVRSWLYYKEQIERCSIVTQALTSHAESQSRQLALPDGHPGAG